MKQWERLKSYSVENRPSFLELLHNPLTRSNLQENDKMCDKLSTSLIDSEWFWWYEYSVLRTGNEIEIVASTKLNICQWGPNSDRRELDYCIRNMVEIDRWLRKMIKTTASITFNNKLAVNNVMRKWGKVTYLIDDDLHR